MLNKALQHAFTRRRAQKPGSLRSFWQPGAAWLLLALAACQAAPATPTPLAASPTIPIPSPVVSPTPAITATPLPTPTPQGCRQTQGQIERYPVETGILAKPLWVRVYVPPCYSQDPAQHYPVLYLLHGQSTDDELWQRLGTTEVADRLIADGEVPPFLIVMPYEEYYLQDPRQSQFGQALVEGLIPWIDRQFNTCRERACRAIGGISRGAAWAMHVGFEDWELFGAIGAHSLPPFINDPYHLPDWLKKIPEDQRPRLYLDIGRLDPYLKPASEFEALLTQYRVPHTWFLNEGTHDEAYWRSQVEAYLRWYAQGWE